ncbi:Similar to Lipoamide acyltransferase component of branched-chain alpha-keto acid dehydrogenase complex, mitochondrial; acc. no. P53395 [Pyronema omphalodes CBS 100304]|uniref:Dihydrolipoamide acetyltransferase component of pyruvate dehydrogenase complex n=1 Tax=Pyronema omphalodes (strain CBS 100304) TaxID=1076935 RepID=U4LGU4_PYROM|nr:Similar to Lipoamide acyltransferase component of branched-chain alpha-keto acid dehydrogenase complex, mitochondrial; acc. no. P53395 [Pyronema omphalodes CBS 100304]
MNRIFLAPICGGRSSAAITRNRQLTRLPHILPRRSFRTSTSLLVVKPFILADIGEGIRECEVIQWFVEPEARVEQFDKLCEVQSDKASVEITSRYDGVIKKLHYAAGEMALVGKPLVDIDLADELASDPELGEGKSAEPEPSGPPSATSIQAAAAAEAGRLSREAAHGGNKVETASEKPVRNNNGKHRSLATPAVRHICKELGVTIEEVIGTGKDGRVLKEDVTRFASSSSANSRSSAAGILEPGLQAASSSPGGLKNPESQITNSRGTPTRPVTPAPELAQETTQPLTRIQSEMFKIMTASLSIPHFLYSDEICLNSITSLRSRLNKDLAKSAAGEAGVDAVKKLTLLPFIIKSVSVSLSQYPLLNSRLDTSSPVPQLITRPSHNIGIAMDTPLGLLVPNIKSVQQLSILEIAAELQRLQSLGAAGKLSPADLRGGTITVSNIGSIGGTVVAPVIVPSEGKVEKREIVNFSWSADHRVVDGATMARMAARVRELVEEPERLLVRLR